jgi:hypothetical protein
MDKMNNGFGSAKHRTVLSLCKRQFAEVTEGRAKQRSDTTHHTFAVCRIQRMAFIAPIRFNIDFWIGSPVQSFIKRYW